MKRKHVIATTVMVLTAASLAACTSTEEKKLAGTQEGTVKPPAKISIFKYLSPGQTYHPDSELEKIIEKDANVDLTYETVPSAEYKTKLSVKLAGGDLSDIIVTNSPGDPEHNTLIDQGVFLALDELLPKFPKLKEAFSEKTWNFMKSPKDGKIYGVPVLRDRGGNGIVIRKDWLDKLGLKVPKTLDELVVVLTAFRDKDPDGNGQNDTIPLTLTDIQASGLYAFFPLFGINPGWSPTPGDANKLQYGLIQPEAKEAMSFLRDLRLKGLLDQDLLVGKTSGLDKFKSGKVGVIVTTLGNYRQVVVLPNMKAEIIDPITHGGNVWKVATPAIPISRTNQISSKSKNPEAALGYLEYQLTRGFDYIQYGVEGKTYSIQNGVKVPFPEDKKDPQYNTTVGLEMLQPEWLFSDPEKYTKFIPKEAAEYLLGKLDTYEKNINYDYLRSNIAIPTLLEKSTVLRQILDEGYTKMLLDSKGDVNKTFDEMVVKWRNGGGDKAIEEVNSLQKDKSEPSFYYKRK
ncbi:extracellular solute-binding protein [Paenibacillus sp. WQ 127069]|uniref:Extracellular solute-binding protein n=1 Tax=Paenibacillus baimaensis TaxID=2982185 RepID=A0ABT2UD55_9BACL|nr:extracellular solute-binding protein [Paenibacillus sp. WQ 127069]MCU6792578.1 extracellular solute-binding protein [Paenibacillus sp. WQ 127069]